MFSGFRPRNFKFSISSTLQPIQFDGNLDYPLSADFSATIYTAEFYQNVFSAEVDQ